jgi:replicative DNA helicase
MSNILLENQVEVVRAIINDLKFNDKPRVIRELVDQLGLYVSTFSEPSLRRFYQASVQVYARMAPQMQHPRFSDILTELETLGEKPDVIELWKKKYSDKQQQRHEYSLCAKNLIDFYLGHEAEEYVREWVNQFSKESNKREEISELIQFLVNLTTDGTEESTPGSILEKAWQTGVRDPEPTGFSAFDRNWAGGWRPGWLACMAIPSGQGKTSNSVSFMCERVRQGRYTLFNSMEQSSEELLFKACCNLSGVLTLEQVERPNERITTQAEWDALTWAKDSLNRYVRIYDTQVPAEEIAMRVRRHQAEFGPSMDFFVVDHVGLTEMNTRSSSDADWLSLLKTSYFLKDTCKKYNAFGLMNSQVPKEVEDEIKKSNHVTGERLGRASKMKEAVDLLVFGGRHNGLVDKCGYDNKFRDTAFFQTTKLRRTGTMSYSILKYDKVHHRLLDIEVSNG